MGYCRGLHSAWVLLCVRGWTCARFMGSRSIRLSRWGPNSGRELLRRWGYGRPWTTHLDYAGGPLMGICHLGMPHHATWCKGSRSILMRSEVRGHLRLWSRRLRRGRRV